MTWNEKCPNKTKQKQVKRKFNIEPTNHQQPTSPQEWSMRPRDAEKYLYIPKPRKKDKFNQARKQNDLKRKVSKQNKKTS